MPNPKTGTVTSEVGKTVKEVKAGKIEFKVDKAGNIHASIGRISFTLDQIVDNVREVLQAIMKLKPAAAKGVYLRTAYLSSTMSPSVQVDIKEFN
jgi:large subunit ribosomal protein L1